MIGLLVIVAAVLVSTHFSASLTRWFTKAATRRNGQRAVRTSLTPPRRCRASVIEVIFSQPKARAAGLHTSCTVSEHDITISARIGADMPT